MSRILVACDNVVESLERIQDEHPPGRSERM